MAGAIASLPAVGYLDLAGTWKITNRLTVRGGVNNAFDRDPPITAGPVPAANGNAFAQVYDVLGRHFFIAVTARF